MSAVQTPALIDIDDLVGRLKRLAGHHKRAGRISHALGVQSALELIKREHKAGKGSKPQN